MTREDFERAQRINSEIDSLRNLEALIKNATMDNCVLMAARIDDGKIMNREKLTRFIAIDFLYDIYTRLNELSEEFNAL